MARKPNNEQWWQEETAFIENESKKKYKMGEYTNYCRMQAKFAEKDGFFDLADRIRSAAKI